jgi:hypothetical protein
VGDLWFEQPIHWLLIVEYWKQPKCPYIEKQLINIHTMEYYAAVRKE